MESRTLHDHVVGFYERADELVAAVTAFVTSALDREGAAIVVATPQHRTTIEAELVARGYAVGDLVVSGRYVALDAEATLAALLLEDHIDPTKFAARMGEVFDAIGTTGPIHAFGEMVALLWDAGNIEAAIELESLWNELQREREFSLYSAYPMASFVTSGDLAAAKGVCDQHTHVERLSTPAVGREPAAHSGANAFRVFVPAPTVIRDVRSFVRELLGQWGEEGCLAEAEVIVTELASNAVVHARSPFRVTVVLTETGIKIAVRDACTVQPENVHGHLDRQGGRGISIIAALSDAWASEPEIDGKTIWATLTRSI